MIHVDTRSFHPLRRLPGNVIESRLTPTVLFEAGIVSLAIEFVVGTDGSIVGHIPALVTYQPDCRTIHVLDMQLESQPGQAVRFMVSVTGRKESPIAQNHTDSIFSLLQPVGQVERHVQAAPFAGSQGRVLQMIAHLATVCVKLE